MNETSRLSRSIPLILALGLILAVFPMLQYPFAWPYETICGNALVHDIYWFAVAVLYIAIVLSYALRLKLSPPPRYVVMFLVLFVYTVLLFFLHERVLSRVDERGQFQSVTLSFTENALYVGEVLYDLLFAFSFLFLWPYAKKDPRYQNLFPFLVVLFGFAASVYGYIESSPNPLPGMSYPYHHSFFVDDVEYGKTLFAAFFSALLLAHSKKGVFKGLYALVGVFLYIAMASQALALAFWASSLALLFFALSVLLGSSHHSALKFFLALSVILLGVLLFLLFLPGAAQTALAPYLQDPFVYYWGERGVRWSNYLQGLSGGRTLLGDGLLGFYRNGFLKDGTFAFSPLNNGFLEAYNAGGVLYLLFYVLLILVGFFALRREESSDGLFFGLVVSFSIAFLFYSTLTSERLLFSSHFVSYIMAYLFSCYTSPAKKRSA